MNFYMVTGFHLDVETWERPVAAVFPRDGDPFMIMNELSTNHLIFSENRETLFVRDYTSIASTHQCEPHIHPRTVRRTRCARLAERGVIRGTIAVEGGPHKLMSIAMPHVQWAMPPDFLWKCAK